MKGFVLGVIAGAAAAVAFNMTDSGSDFCAAQKRNSQNFADVPKKN